MRFRVDPSVVTSRVKRVLDEVFSRAVPLWAIEQFLPYEGSVILSNDFDSGNVVIHVLVNERRMGPVIVTLFNESATKNALPREVAWDDNGMVFEKRGVITVEGKMGMDTEAKEAVWYQWHHPAILRPIPLRGGHLFEGVLDNRDGGAYLVTASYLKAFHIVLDKREQEISLSTLQFVTSVRVEADVIEPDTLKIRLEFDIVPEARNRLAVINLKVAIDESFEQRARQLKRDHEISFIGTSRWVGTTIIWEYEMDKLDEASALAIDNRLL